MARMGAMTRSTSSSSRTATGPCRGPCGGGCRPRAASPAGLGLATPDPDPNPNPKQGGTSDGERDDVSLTHAQRDMLRRLLRDPANTVPG